MIGPLEHSNERDGSEDLKKTNSMITKFNPSIHHIYKTAYVISTYTCWSVH